MSSKDYSKVFESSTFIFFYGNNKSIVRRNASSSILGMIISR